MNDPLLIALIVAFLCACLFAPFFIPLLRLLKFGQYIRDEGPEAHKKKAGTPTMGGVIIIVGLVAATLITGWKFNLLSTHMWLLLMVTVGYAIIGFLDDFIKIVMKRNLGLTSKQKLLGQLVVAGLFYIGLLNTGYSTVISVPGTDWSINLGGFYLILLIIMLLGTSNGTNLTDGMDGLLAGTAAIAFGAYIILAQQEMMVDVAVFTASVTGALLGFLVFNAHPAKVFMGDTGSLALGGALAAIAVLTKAEILLIVVGGIYVIETLSVMIQVAAFKMTGKRVFKMSPLHHHYELSGWSEWRIVSTFWFTGLLFAVLGIYIRVWL